MASDHTPFQEDLDDSESIASDLSTEQHHAGFEQDLLEAFTSIQSTGSFASFAKIGDDPPADIHVDGIGDITMPLNETQALQLIEIAKQAPYGKGSETIVDVTVRNTFELDPSQFSFRNPKWTDWMKNLGTHVAKRLGINVKIRAEIYKMLIYNKGGMFKAHTDTEKIPGMFGTLAVCLPSPHTGGAVVVKHGGREKIFETCRSAQSMICWYSDVSHEVLPVLSGYRWVLTYNLAIDPTQARPSAGLQKSEARPLHHALRRWLAQSRESRGRDCICHILDHDYTEANTSLRALKARDLTIVQTLQDAGRSLPFAIFLALLEREERGNCESHYDDYRRRSFDSPADEPEWHDLDDIIETEHRVKKLFDLEGNVVSQDLSLAEDDILEDDWYELLNGEEEYEGYMGNWGPTATHWYRFAAVVIVPLDSLNHFFKSRERDLQHQVAYLTRACLDQSKHDSLMDALIELCNRNWERRRVSELNPRSFYAPEPRIEGQPMHDLLRVALERKRYTFFQRAADRHAGRLPYDFFTWVRSWLASGQISFDTLKPGLTSAVSSYPALHGQFNAIAHFVPLPASDSTQDITLDSSDSIATWLRERLRIGLDTRRRANLKTKDGSAMVNLASYFENPTQFLSLTVVPKANEGQQIPSFYLDFLRALRTYASANNCMHLYWDNAKSFISSTEWSTLRSEAGIRLGTPKRARHTLGDSHLRNTVSKEALLDFFHTLVDISSENQDIADPFVSKLIIHSITMPAAELVALWMPFLQSSVTVLTSLGISLQAPRYQQLYCTLLEAYITKYVKKPPSSERTLLRPRVDCSCGDCTRLNHFLTDNSREMAEFPVGKQRRAHLHQKLDKAHIDCTHETIRTGNPQTLLVTKTFRNQEAEHRNWEARKARALEQIQKFDQEQLRLLLGTGYSSIVNLSIVIGDNEQRHPMTGLSSADQRTIANQRLYQSRNSNSKRALPPSDVEIIDLTSD